MKKIILLCLSAVLMLTCTGCTLGDLADQYLIRKDAEPTAAPSQTERVYIDEVTGVVVGFNGSSLTVLKDKTPYTFDLSEATIECTSGILSGSPISVIYEGKLTGGDAATVKVLNVADVIHPLKEPEEKSISGTLKGMTSNTCTIATENGETVTVPSTGAVFCFRNGIRPDKKIYIHYIGEFLQAGTTDAPALNAKHLKVKSISDEDPLPTLKSADLLQGNPYSKCSRLLCTLVSVAGNVLTLLPADFDVPLQLDVSGCTCSFRGGMSPGQTVNIWSLGEFSGGDSLQGLNILSVTGDNPGNINKKDYNYQVKGTVVGSTADTVTILTEDGARVTCRIEGVPDSSTYGPEEGYGVAIIIDPEASASTNIYESLRIRDIE